jgi:hypothetical protein
MRVTTGRYENVAISPWHQSLWRRGLTDGMSSNSSRGV